MEIERTENPLLERVAAARLKEGQRAKAQKAKAGAESEAAARESAVEHLVPLIQRVKDVRDEAVQEAQKYLEFPDWDCIENARRAALRIMTEGP